MNSKPDLQALIDRLPDSDSPGKESTFTGPPPADAEALVKEVLGGGRETILELAKAIRMAGDPDYKSFRAEYLLRCVSLYAGAPGREVERALVAKTLVEALADPAVGRTVKPALLREIHLLGSAEVAPALGEALLDGDLADPAARALVGSRLGVEVLRAALGRATGKARLSVLQALGELADADSAEAFAKALGDEDREVRITAAWALARLGDPSRATVLLEAAAKAADWEKTQVTKACFVLAETLASSGKKEEAKSVYARILDSRKEAEAENVRATAQRGLDSLK